ncbi:LAME_0C06744g1_1 [Lachancea meyersii CBS 8951]|uniref:LAME_0C06744g1_1 n=1 Tax=Lachancea meyersii CBS 8951 TaxID=1266667 RepID=A0A1G4J293_9SACH|nr:LAME_0C06744g1_1 [Lachancea meyersii CBS 8951]
MSSIPAIDLTQEDSDDAGGFSEFRDNHFKDDHTTARSLPNSTVRLPRLNSAMHGFNSVARSDSTPQLLQNNSRKEETPAKDTRRVEQLQVGFSPSQQLRPLFQPAGDMNLSIDGIYSPGAPDLNNSSDDSLFKRRRLEAVDSQGKPQPTKQEVSDAEQVGYVSPLSLTSRESSPKSKVRLADQNNERQGDPRKLQGNDITSPVTGMLNEDVPSRVTKDIPTPENNSKNALGSDPGLTPISATLSTAPNSNESPIIVLSDEEDDLNPVLRGRANGVDGEVKGPSTSNSLASANASVERLRAIHDKNLKLKVQKDQEFARLKNTCRDTRIILQRKLQKRERHIQEIKSKLSPVIPSENSLEPHSDMSLDAELLYMEERRQQTLAKLHQLDTKEVLAFEEHTKFFAGHGSKLRQSQMDLQNALSSRLHATLVDKRAKLMEEKMNVDRLYKTRVIDLDTMVRKKTAIDKALNELQSTQLAPKSPDDSQSSDVYFRSIDVATDLIRKNSVRSSENKTLMERYLKVVAQFKRACDKGDRFSPQTRYLVEKAITELFRHGVKMPAVSAYLKRLNFIVLPEDFDKAYSSKAVPAENDDFQSVDGTLGADNDILELVKSQDEQRQTNSFQLSSIYNSQDNDSLQKLLEGLKTTEAEIEGEELTPPELTVNLMKHQRQGLYWLLQVERSSKKGGLLADDMGLGKTVQAIALMVANRSADEKCKTNLIVAPVAVLRVWQAEVRTKVNKTTGLKVLIFGSSNGAKVENYRSLLRYDVVLVSYQTLASELKKHWPAKLTPDSEEPTVVDVPDVKAINSMKERNEYWSPFFCDQSQFYRVILDEAQNIKNKKTQSSKACCALNSTYRWALSGTPVQNNIMELYSLIRFLRISPYNREQRFRLDIGNPLGRASNDYDSFDRKQATKKVQVLLRAVMLRRTKDSQIDGKPILELPPKFINDEEETLQGQELAFYTDLEQKNQKKAEKLMNNRSKGNYSNILTLLLRLRQACCHSELVVLGEHKSETSKVANGKNFENDWLRLFELARRMPGVGKDTVVEGLEKMTCPYCMEQMELDSTVVITPCGHMLCDGCAEQYFEDVRSQGNSRKIVNSGYAVPCLVCNRIIDDNEVVTYKLYDQAVNQNLTVQGLRAEYETEMRAQKDRLKNGYQINYDTLQPSPKILQCLEIFRKVLESAQQEKIIVFSQFTTFFDLLQHFIRKELGVHYLRYDGSMNAQARANTIDEFYKNPNRRILLISMKAGNSGLTLTCANHVILVDPFWNPFVEEQAMDRCYRISQTREVQVHKLLVKNSVEDRILELQKKKKELVESAMSPDKIQEVNSLGRRELGFLFGLNTLN